MRSAILTALSFSLALTASAIAQDDKDKGGDKSTPAPNPAFFKAQESVTQGSLRRWRSCLLCGACRHDHCASQGLGRRDRTARRQGQGRPAEASMFYVAYFKKGADARSGRSPSSTTAAPAPRPSGCTWAPSARAGWSPRDDSHTPAAPYQLVDNAYSLLDASDLVFIDAPGTGFSRIAGKDKEKAFCGVDADAHAFARVHHRLPVEIRPLELAQIPVRRKLRHAALGGAGQRAGDRATTSTSTA